LAEKTKDLQELGVRSEKKGPRGRNRTGDWEKNSRQLAEKNKDLQECGGRKWKV